MEAMNQSFTWHVNPEERTRRSRPQEVTALCGARTINMVCLSIREILSRAFPDDALCPACRRAAAVL